MIITVDPSQSEDIAAFAMVKQYRMQALNVTLNGGTGSDAWQAVQGGEGYTQTVVTPVTGIELVYEDPNAIVSYTVENDDTSNYDVASNAGIILSSIEPTDNVWTYTCVFHADSVPVSSVDIDLLVYGNIARGTEQQGSPATAEEITAQVLAGLETRVLALETEMPTKADVATTYTKSETDALLALKADQATTYTKAETDTLLASKADTATTYTKTETDTLLARYVTLNTAQTITAVKTLTIENGLRRITTYARGSGGQATWKLTQVDKDGNNLVMVDIRDDGTSRGVHLRAFDDNGNNYTALATNTQVSDGTSFVQIATRGYNPAYTSDVATIGTLDAYTPMVRTSDNQTIYGIKTFLSGINIGDETHPDSSSLILWASGAYRRFRMRSNVDDVTTTPASNVGYGLINFSDKNDQTACNLLLTHKSTGGYKLEALIQNSNNGFNTFTIGETN